MNAPRSLVFRRAQTERRGPLFNAELPEGTSAVITPDERLAQSFLTCAAGMLAPVTGKVLLGGTAPFRNPALRAKMPVVLPWEPELPSDRTAFSLRRNGRHETVEQRLQSLLALRNRVTEEVSFTPRELPFCERLLERSTHQLDNRDRRRISVSLALSQANPLALLLFEPLNVLSPVEANQALHLITEHAASGTVVVIVTRNLREAEHLTDTIHHMRPPPVPRYPEAIRYAVHSKDAATLSRRMVEKGLDCRPDDDFPGRLFVQSTDEETLVEKLNEAIFPERDELGLKREVAAVSELYEATAWD